MSTINTTEQTELAELTPDQETLFNKYLSKVPKIINKWYFLDNAESIVLENLLKAVRNFDSKYGASFMTLWTGYSRKHLLNEYLYEIRRVGRDPNMERGVRNLITQLKEELDVTTDPLKVASLENEITYLKQRLELEEIKSNPASLNFNSKSCEGKEDYCGKLVNRLPDTLTQKKDDIDFIMDNQELKDNISRIKQKLSGLSLDTLLLLEQGFTLKETFDTLKSQNKYKNIVYSSFVHLVNRKIKAKFTSTFGITQSKRVLRSSKLFNKDTIDKTIKELETQLTVPFKEITKGILSTEGIQRLIIKLSLTPKSSWEEFKNSKYMVFYLDSDGTMDLLTTSPDIKLIFKSKKYKTIQQVIRKLNMQHKKIFQNIMKEK